MKNLSMWMGRGAAALALAALTGVIFEAYLEPSVLLPLLSGIYLCR
jgi:hypothetical protein